jgi:alkylated DNA repair dioxygenase AlkB
MKIIENLISKEECDILAKQIKLKERPRGDSLVPLSFSAYALPHTESLLLLLTDTISNAVDKQLRPTYSYARIYYTGATMPKHTDRPACEISLSLSLSGDPWPLWFDLNVPTPVSLNKGSAVVYRGIETAHWREQYTGSGCTQVFLHWVDACGPYADWQYDKRPAIGTGESEKFYWGKS